MQVQGHGGHGDSPLAEPSWQWEGTGAHGWSRTGRHPETVSRRRAESRSGGATGKESVSSGTCHPVNLPSSGEDNNTKVTAVKFVESDDGKAQGVLAISGPLL